MQLRPYVQSHTQTVCWKQGGGEVDGGDDTDVDVVYSVFI